MKTKEEVKSDLFKEFGIRDTGGFKTLLKCGEFIKAADVIQYVEKNINEIPHYGKDWISDRKKELAVARKRQERGDPEIEPKRSKEEAKAELMEKFGFSNTAGFFSAIKRGDIEIAKRWLGHIVSDPANFPQYLPTWDCWLEDRNNEIRKALHRAE